MRAREFIFEDSGLGADPTTNNLKLVLDTLRSRYEAAHETPKIRIRSVINMVRSMPGSEMFNIDNLMRSYDEDENLKNLISDIKKDPATGVPYIFLKSAEEDLIAKFDQEPDSDLEPNDMEQPTDELGLDKELPDDGNAPGGADQLDMERLSAEQTVDQMSKRALKKRQ